jgi:hypothetical protein
MDLKVAVSTVVLLVATHDNQPTQRTPSRVRGDIVKVADAPQAKKSS